jgi:signal transduction histidine kinase/DNA-binding response OmpR family regulator/streptogramin lyase
MRFEPGTHSFSYFRHDPLAQQGINSNVPTALFRDRSGVMWVGTNGFGINIHDPKADRFHTVRRPDDRPSRQSGFSVYTLFEDGAGRVWVDAGVLYRWDRATGGFTSFETSSDRPDDFGNTGVWSLVEDPPGFLWAGTYQGLYHYQIETAQYRQFKHDPRDAGGLPEPVVYDVFKDRTGAIWVVTENYVARLIDAARGRFRSYRYNERPSTGQWAFPSTWQDADGSFWLGSRQGLVRFDADAGTFRYFRHDPARPASLSHDVVKSILPDPREPRVLWIGTAGGGLNRFDVSAETFSALTETDGLPNNVVYGVLADNDGRLWLSTNKGISRFDPRTRELRNFDVNDGLQSNEFNSGAYFRSKSGELFFGGIYGFNHFYPADVEENRHVPPIVITGFKRLNRYETVRDSGSVLKSAISETDELRLSYRDDVITFEFAALDYSAPSKNRYAYRLAGFNNEWIESGSVRSATYANLPPGRYSFQVRGSNNDGIWNQEGASIDVIIAPPWWRTWWAYALYALAVLSALYGLRRHEMRRIRLEHHLALERVEKEQMRELDRERSRFFANVSHEFRTPLTLTLGPLDDVLAGRHGSLSDAMREPVDLARRSAARVLDLINQILGLARLEAGHTTLRARRLDVGAFVENLAMTFRPFAERKALVFQVQVPAELVDVYADPDHLERILSNLLSNAFKFTPAGGNIRVSIEADVATVCIAVRDNGPGIAAADLARIFDRFHRAHESSVEYQPGTGIGLALAKELAELHGGCIEVASEEGFGSTFTVRLKRGRAHLKPDQVIGDDAADAWKPAATQAASSATSPADATPAAAIDDEDVTTVLVIEDNAEVRAYVRKQLSPAYRVLEADNGDEGLALTREFLPDLVLSDVMMPGLDGHALCRAIKTDPETDFIPVILLTARAAPEDRLAGLHERADDYLTKPFDVKELLARIENLIASRKRLRERFGGVPALSLHPTAVNVVPADAKFLEQVRVAIEASIGDEDFTVEQLARQVAHSRGHLHRRLRALLDESPSDLVRRMRLERAAQLLAAGSGSVAEVAYSVGFKSVAHFSNSFNEHFGVRPSAYRVLRSGAV